MGKSNYEIYADKKQKEILESTCTLQAAIEKLKIIKVHFSHDYFEAACETIAKLYDLTYDELNNAVDGKEYWIV